MWRTWYLSALILTACVSFPKADVHQQSCVPRIGQLHPSDSSITRPGGEVVTKTVRFTDDGEFVNRCELTDLFFELMAKPETPETVVVYVHGWKHNGDANDEDLIKFGEALQHVRTLEPARSTQRRVVGVYVAWNGKQTAAPILKELTFWGRKRAADRVSQSAAVTRLLGSVDSIRTKRKNDNDLVVYVGHSFGARILYNAVAQVLIHRTELAHPGRVGGEYDVIRGIGDMVILLNPAFEASLFTTFNDVRRPEYRFRELQPPLLVSISSETDRATKIAFPIGQTLSFDTAARRRTTLGNYAQYATHRLAPVSHVSTSMAANHEICAKEVCLFNIRPSEPKHVPFISAIADRDVMDGHGDVWNPKLVDFLAKLISSAGVSAPPNSR